MYFAQPVATGSTKSVKTQVKLTRLIPTSDWTYGSSFLISKC